MNFNENLPLPQSYAYSFESAASHHCRLLLAAQPTGNLRGDWMSPALPPFCETSPTLSDRLRHLMKSATRKTDTSRTNLTNTLNNHNKPYWFNINLNAEYQQKNDISSVVEFSKEKNRIMKWEKFQQNLKHKIRSRVNKYYPKSLRLHREAV